jgi:hypothetical protein
MVEIIVDARQVDEVAFDAGLYLDNVLYNILNPS